MIPPMASSVMFRKGLMESDAIYEVDISSKPLPFCDNDYEFEYVIYCITISIIRSN